MTVLKLDANALTVGDMEDFEEHAGISLDAALAEHRVQATEDVREQSPELVDKDGWLLDEKGRPVKQVRPSYRALAVLIWIVKRAENPAYTLDDARREKVSSLEFAPAAELDPTQPPA